jgi:hypothetical protein
MNLALLFALPLVALTVTTWRAVGDRRRVNARLSRLLRAG